MSGDESFLLIVSLIIAFVAWAVWYSSLFSVARLGLRTPPRQVLALGPLVCLALLFLVLRGAAAQDVRDSGTYLGLYMAFGAAWIGGGAHLTRLLGLSARDDVVERGNTAAAVALAGALVGITLCFAGGNIGDGPGWWVVLFSALLATGGLMLLWYVLDRGSGVAEQITVERDVAAGLRLGGFLVACGLVLGRAVAGDWVSAAATMSDFWATSWPVLPLLVIAVAVDRVTRVTPERLESSPFPHGALPALVYIGLSALHVLRLGAIR